MNALARALRENSRRLGGLEREFREEIPFSAFGEALPSLWEAQDESESGTVRYWIARWMAPSLAC